MAMAVRAEEDEPPKGGDLPQELPISQEIRSLATPRRVVQHGVYRISAPDSVMSHLQGAVKAAAHAVAPADREYGAYRESVEIPKAADAASIAYDDEERTRLDIWLAHACPMDYTAAIKTRRTPDPDKDWKDVDGIRVAAPQRLRKVKRLEKNDSGKLYPVWELVPDTKLTPDTFVERPAQYIDDWSELGVQRAKKAYLKRATASQDKRADLGKSRLEPPTIPKVLVRRPPDLMWFLRNPDGQGLIYNEPYPHGTVDEGANMEHNRRISECTNNLKYNGRKWGDADLRTIGFSLRYFQEMHPASGKERLPSEDISDDWYSEHHDLNAYKETLLREQTAEVVQHSRTEKVTGGMVSALENLTESIAGRDGLIQKGTKVQTMKSYRPVGSMLSVFKKMDAPENWDKGENFIGKLAPHEVRTRNEPANDSHFPGEGVKYSEIVVEEGEDQTRRFIGAATNQLELLRNRAEMESYVEETIRDTFSSLKQKGHRVFKSYPDQKDQLFISAVAAELDYDDPNTLEFLELLLKRQEETTKTVKNCLAKARLTQHDPEGWITSDEYNTEGIINDEQFEIEIERIPVGKTIRPEPLLHNQCKAHEHFEEMRAAQREWDRATENRKKFFERAERREKRRLKVARQRAKNLRRQKLRTLATYHYKLLYEVRQINKPMPQEKRATVNWFNERKEKFLDSRVEKRLKKMKSYTYRSGQAADFRKIRDLLKDGPHSARGWAIAETLEIEKELNPTRMVSETPHEMTYTVQEPKGIELVVKRQARQNLKWDREMIFEDLVVPGTVKAPAEKPICAPSSGAVYSTKGISRIHGGDYTTPLGKLWKSYIVEFGGPPPRRYKTEVKHETVEETEHRDQQVGPGAYKPAEQRRLDAPTLARMAKRRDQRHRRLVA